MSHDDEPRGPGVPTITWVTLGLLAFSWMATNATVIVYVVWPGKPDALLATIAASGTASVSYILHGIAAWRVRFERADFLANVLVLAVFTALIAASSLLKFLFAGVSISSAESMCCIGVLYLLLSVTGLILTMVWY